MLETGCHEIDRVDAGVEVDEEIVAGGRADGLLADAGCSGGEVDMCAGDGCAGGVEHAATQRGGDLGERGGGCEQKEEERGKCAAEIHSGRHLTTLFVSNRI